MNYFTDYSGLIPVLEVTYYAHNNASIMCESLRSRPSRARRIYYDGGGRGRENTSGVSRGHSLNFRNSITA